MRTLFAIIFACALLGCGVPHCCAQTGLIDKGASLNNGACIGPCSGASQAAGLPSTFFNITVNQSNGSIWPGTGVANLFIFNGIRTWNMTQPTGPNQLCPNSGWHCINYAAGLYDFTSFDNGVGKAIAAGQTDILATMFGSPNFAVTCPSPHGCGFNGACSGPLAKLCYPPDDVCTNGQAGTGSCATAANGGGSSPNNAGADTNFKTWTTALINHIIANSWQGNSWTFEIGNEPNYPGGWKGTIQQLATEACDAYFLVKAQNAAWKVTSPAPSDGNSTTVNNFLNASVPAGTGRGPASCNGTGCTGKQCIDAIGIHDYPPNGKVCPNTCPSPENIGNQLNGIIGLGAGLPIYITEGSQSPANLNNSNSDPSHERAAYLARGYLMLGLGSGAGGQATRVYWYCWDCDTSHGTGNSSGDLWGNWLGPPQAEVEQGTAYRQIRAWLAGSVVTSPCNPLSGTSVWTCNFTTSGGILRQVVWDANVTGSNSCFVQNNAAHCLTYTVPATYPKMCTLLGGTTSSPISGTLQLTSTPILLTASSDAVCN